MQVLDKYCIESTQSLLESNAIAPCDIESDTSGTHEIAEQGKVPAQGLHRWSQVFIRLIRFVMIASKRMYQAIPTLHT